MPRLRLYEFRTKRDISTRTPRRRDVADIITSASRVTIFAEQREFIDTSATCSGSLARSELARRGVYRGALLHFDSRVPSPRSPVPRYPENSIAEPPIYLYP